jgi:SM-20-related protein
MDHQLQEGKMPTAEFFARFGLYVVPQFLDAELCREIVDYARQSDWSPAEVIRGSDSLLDEASRRTLRRRVPRVKRADIKERLHALKPALEEYFHLPLLHFEEPQVLRYRENDFFQAHRDSTPEQGSHEVTRNRRISVTIFLNSQSEESIDGAYSGGSLVFYGLLPDARAKECGFPLQAHAGTLVAFPSDLLHEVKPVLRGERYSVVSWYAADPVAEPHSLEADTVGAGAY